MARRAAFLALLLLASSPLTAMADRPAGDVAEVVESDAVMALPDAPDDYGAERRGDVRWEFPAQAADVAHELQEVYEEHWSRLAEELGGDTEGPLTIRIGRNPEEMSALAPLGAPPPAYASGVAYPARGLILLTLAAPETWQRPDVDSVLVHELSHIALHRAMHGRAAQHRRADWRRHRALVVVAGLTEHRRKGERCTRDAWHTARKCANGLPERGWVREHGLRRQEPCERDHPLGGGQRGPVHRRLGCNR